MKTQTVTDLNIPVDDVILKGVLAIPDNPVGLVIFSHGSGSSRLSPRNNYVARSLNDQGFATLLFDLLTEEEDKFYSNRFDIPLLSKRLKDTTRWIRSQKDIARLPIGYFGASTGAASALNAAANSDLKLKAIVSRGGRPDLADDLKLASVPAPVLLIVGGWDQEVIALNRSVLPKFGGYSKLEIVPEASHLFQESGKLEIVTQLCIAWFQKYLII
ncbi:dienelactone hydrolase family protein [Robertkochia solimangrovi]|uniref:dienelactone hydrolase family protein n=1 Tax=Robertkochia solimangrovi TaxID=2213046 RepID=UPI00117F8578|nr:dienelactone hydrolase family protein [Robertkochia solimangrovi]TRZ40979.1 alpha/beta hydrolase [Robertkochia solimangrovi]